LTHYFVVGFNILTKSPREISKSPREIFTYPRQTFMTITNAIPFWQESDPALERLSGG